MGSSTAFSYPQLDQLYLNFLSIPFLKKCIKIISCSLLFSLQDQTLFYFLLGDRNCLDQRNRSKNPMLFGLFKTLGRMQLQITSPYKEMRLAFLSQLSWLDITGRGTVGLRIQRGELFVVKSLPLPTKSESLVMIITGFQKPGNYF